MIKNEFEKGRVVVSLAGRNKGKFAVVLKVEENRVYIADGKEYTVAQPKPKNPVHLESQPVVLQGYEFEFDSRLRKTLNRMNKQNNPGR